MLSVQDVHTYYGDSYVLQGVTLDLKAGQVVALLGRNGVGKTTLARSILGLTPAKRGTILFKDVDITGMPAHRIARMGIGLVPQGRQVFRSLTVKEHLQVTARGRGRWNFERVAELFPNLRSRMRSLAGLLSGGEQQMLAAGRALVGNPALLVMDEPTEGLAPIMVRELGRAIESLKQAGTSILLIEQQLAFALRYADVIFIMSKGRIVHQCTPAELAADAQIKARYLGVQGPPCAAAAPERGLMKHSTTQIPGVLLLEPRYFHDARGYFVETYNARVAREAGLHAEFVQDNQALSLKRGTVRALHFQLPPRPQAKLVRVLHGSIYDVAVDLRLGSPSFGKWTAATLTAQGGEQLFVPRGLAHGYCTLEDGTEVAYKVDDYYAPECEHGLAWDDPTLAIPWPVAAADALLADRDRRLPRFADFSSPFRYDGGR